MFGYDIKNKGISVENSDAEILFRTNGVMLEDSKPWAITSCIDKS